MGSNDHNGSLSPDKAAALEELRYTRDFGLYLDLLNEVKGEYLIILCLKDTSGHNISEAAAEKIRRLGFSKYTTEPDMKYVGVLHNGSVICDFVLKASDTHENFSGSIPDATLNISFEEKEGEICINGNNQSLNDKGINIAVYDVRSREITDAACYNAAGSVPVFFHRNLDYTDKYIAGHIYMPEEHIDSITLPMRRSYFSNRRLNVREVERGIFLPIQKKFLEIDTSGKTDNAYRTRGGICDENFTFIAGHQSFSPTKQPLDSRHVSDSYTVEREEIVYIDETVLYAGVLTEHPGHLIVECFADRLWWLAQNPDTDIKVAAETIWEKNGWATDTLSFVRQLLDAFGISQDRLIFIDKPTQFRKIIVPDQSAIPMNYCFPYEFTKEYILPFRHITKQLTPGKYKKIYFTKSKTLKSNTVGEKFFIDFFEKKGFTIIHPEDYTMKEKAEMMYGAEEVVTIDGTSSLFTVFCKPTVRLTILARRKDFWDMPQQLINEAVGIKEFYLVNVSGNFLDSFSENIFMNYATGMTVACVTREFKDYVKNVYNEEIGITTEESLKNISWDFLTRFPMFYSQPQSFFYIRNVKMRDVLRSMSEVFCGVKLEADNLDHPTAEEAYIKKLENQLGEERAASDLIAEKAKGFIDEITSLKRALAQCEAENQQLRDKNAELTAYMAEISRLLDALEAQDGAPPEG